MSRCAYSINRISRFKFNNYHFNSMVFKKKESLYKYDSEALVYRKTNRLLKYRIIVAVLFISFGATLISAVQFKSEISEKEIIIKEKENRIKQINSPLREEFYIEDLTEAIGHNFTEKEKLQVEDLALRHREKIEKAKVPMTLVVWIAYKESRFDVKAKNPNSSACGLFGFIDGTWNEMCKLKGVGTEGRFNEDKQVDILITYLNYLYNKHGDWKAVMQSYHGGELQYPFKFLLK